MVLFAIAGELGAGKTLSATFLMWKNWFQRQQKTYSNIHLFKIPYKKLNYVSELMNLRKGFVLADELWLIADSRLSRNSSNMFTASILSKSRKRQLTFIITTQLLESLDRRIRKVLDFSAVPILNRTETICKTIVFRTGYPSNANVMKSFYYYTDPIKQMYDTNEEVIMIDDISKRKTQYDIEEEKEIDEREKEYFIFQPNYIEEHGYNCQCEKCGTKFFKTWEDADNYARDWWEKNMSRIIIQ